MNDFVELRKVTSAILKWWWLLILFSIMAAAAGYAVSLKMTRIYQATTTLMVGQSIQATDLSGADIQTSESLAQTYANLASRYPVLQGAIDTLDLDIAKEDLRDRVRVELVEGTQLLEIKVNASSPELAEAIANEIAHQLILISPTALLSQERDANQRFVHQRLESLQTKIEAGQKRLEELDAAMTGSLSAEQVQEIQTEINELEQLIADWENNFTQLLVFVESERSPNYLVVIEPAQAGSDPIRPLPFLYTLLAGVVGLIMGISLALILDYLDDTLKSTDDLSQSLGLTTLGSVGRITGKYYSDKLITSQDLFSATAEAYRMVRSNIEFMSVDQPAKSIVVTSSGPGEGKSTTVANLGIVMAQAGLKTVIVDADLRRPTQHQIFQVPNLGGLTDLLCSAEPKIESHLRKTATDNLYVISSGVLPPNPAELLSSQRMKQLIVHLSELADVVIYDSPPVLVVTDATVLSNRVDGTIVVTRAGKTRYGAVKQTISNLRQAGANLLGGVINQAAGKRGGYYQPYYASDSYSQRRSVKPPPKAEPKNWRERVPFFSIGLGRLDALNREPVVASPTSIPLIQNSLGQQVARPERQLRETAITNPIKANHGQAVAGEPPKPGLRWLFLAALILVLWQVPFLNTAYRQAGIRTFLQMAFQNGALPAHLPWSGQVEADPAPVLEHLEQANDPFVPLQMSLDADRALGVVAVMTGNATEAQQRLMSRLKRTPEDRIARFFLGEAYHRLDNTSAAIEQWAIAGAQEPLKKLAKDLIEGGEKSTALTALEAVMRLNKTDTEPRWLAADILIEQGATQQALALYQEIRTINPYSEAAHRRVANIWLQQGNLEQALTEYQAMIDIAPQQPMGYVLMGQALFEAQHYEEAVKFLEQALQRDPKEPDLLLEMLGEFYAGLERWAEAIQSYEQVIDLNSNRQRAYALLGEAQCQVGTAAEARFYFEQAVALGNQQEQVRQAIQYIAQQGVCPP